MERNEKTAISRRSFVRGLGASALAATAAGIVGCAPSAATSADQAPSEEESAGTTEAQASTAPSGSNESGTANPSWLGSAPVIDEGNVVDTWDTDLLIVGAGNGGMLAAARAADAGMDFRIIEKMGQPCMSRDFYAAINTDDCLAAGCKVDVQKFKGEVARYASGKCDSRLVNVFVDESPAMHEYVKQIMDAYGFDCAFSPDTGVETSGTDYYCAPIQHTYSARPDSEYATLTRNTILEDYIGKKGYSVDYNTDLVELIEEDRTVKGAYAQTPEGIVRINAKNVLLASGGYAANPDMVSALQPLVCQCVNTMRYHQGNTGQGLKAALWVGAAKDVEPSAVIFDRGAVAPGIDSGYVEGPDGTMAFPGTLCTQENEYNPGSQPFLKVNRDGQRFANESCPYNDILFAAASQKGGTYCQVYDANFKADWERFHTLGCSAISRMIPDVMAAGIEQNVEDGIIMKADTVDELADKLGFSGDSKATFLATVDRYNELYDNQDDPDFGKAAYRLSEIRTAPFYGVWMGGLLLTTLDGAKINEDMQVLDVDREPIAGLYATGDVSGGMFANNYPELLPGLACGRTLTFAIHAVDFVAQNA